MLLGTLLASLLGNMLTGKTFIQASDGYIRGCKETKSPEGQGTIRVG